MDRQDLRESIVENFIHMALDRHRENKDEYTDEQLLAMAKTLLSFSGDEIIVTGTVAEELFYDTYQTEYKRQMGQTEDSEDWSGDIDWRPLQLPLNVVRTVALYAATRDAIKTKAWYAYCKREA